MRHVIVSVIQMNDISNNDDSVFKRVRELDEMFKLMDKNNDGSLSEEEFITCIMNDPKLSETFLKF
jgi:Ca2+-binding EF-hand superfamily protein